MTQIGKGTQGGGDPSTGKRPEEKTFSDPGVSFDPFRTNPDGTAITVNDPNAGSTTPVATGEPIDPEYLVLGKLPPDDFISMPEKAETILSEPTPQPDVTSMSPSEAKSAMARWNSREQLRSQGVALKSLVPEAATSQLGAPPTAASIVQLLDGAVQASATSLGDMWRFTVSTTLSSEKLVQASSGNSDQSRIADIQGMLDIGDLLDVWVKARDSAADETTLANAADRLSSRLKRELTRFAAMGPSGPASTDSRSLKLQALSTAVVRQLTGQIAESLMGRSFAARSPVDGVAYLLKVGTSRYQGAFGAMNDPTQIKMVLAQSSFYKEPAGQKISNAMTAFSTAVSQIEEAHKDPAQQGPGAIPLGKALTNLATAADSLTTALVAAKKLFDPKVGTGPSRIEVSQIESIGMYMSTKCQSIVSAEPLAGNKFKNALTNIRSVVNDSLVSETELSDSWSSAQDSFVAGLSALNKTLASGMKSDLQAINIEAALKDWMKQAKGMPDTTADLYSATWKVATCISNARSVIGLSKLSTMPAALNARLDVQRALDNIATTVSSSMTKYSAYFPEQFRRLLRS